MKASLTTHLRYNAERFPEKPVFIYPGQHSNWEIVTYRQLSERSNRLARGLVTYGIRPGTRAALMLPPSVDMFALVFALLQTGIVPIMVDPAIGLRNVTPCLAESEPEVYFGSALTHAIRHVFGWGKASLRLNLTLTDILRAGVSTPDVQPVQLNPNDEAAIVYTSGSTGLPKGAIYTLANFDAQIELLANTLQLNGSEVDLPAFPLFAIIDCLLGVTAVIPDMRFPAPAKVNPIRMLTAIHTHQVDTMFVSPVALASLSLYCTENNLKLPSLRKVITAGAPAPAKIQEQFTKLLSTGSELFGIYGSTEALPVSIVNSSEILH
ncbi:MAG: AMP-binding protein, partial [Chloroflexota bacterium]